MPDDPLHWAFVAFFGWLFFTGCAVTWWDWHVKRKASKRKTDARQITGFTYGRRHW